MIDLHCHILPGIDDRAKDLKDSLAMARMVVTNESLIFQPHHITKLGFGRMKKM